MKRRNFLSQLALGLAFTTAAAVLLSWFRQFFPPQAGRRKVVNLGDPEQFPVDTYTFLKEHQLFVYRDHEGVRAVSAVCTHLGCIVNRKPDGFECPCHGSVYDREGHVQGGPAPGDLECYRMGLATGGRLWVDPSERVNANDKLIIS